MTTEPAGAALVAQPKRGQTVVSDRVRQRLIEHAVLSVPGVVRRRTIVPGGTLPAVRIGGGPQPRAVDVDIAANWPVDGTRILNEVESAVSRELALSLGEHPRHLGVQISRIVSDRTPAQVADAYAAGPEPNVGTAGGRERFAPRRTAASTISGVLIALIVIAAGVVAVRDALIDVDWISGGAWITPLLGWAGRAEWQWWTWPAAVVAVLAGGILLVVAVKPRRRAYHSVGEGVWVQRHAVEAWHSESAREPGSEGDEQ